MIKGSTTWYDALTKRLGGELRASPGLAQQRPDVQEIRIGYSGRSFHNHRTTPAPPQSHPAAAGKASSGQSSIPYAGSSGDVRSRMSVKRRQRPQPVQLEDVPDPHGMNRWAGIPASLVTAHRDSQPRSGHSLLPGLPGRMTPAADRWTACSA